MRRGMTIVELLVMASLSVLILGIIWNIYKSSTQQERQLNRHLDMQRGLRGSMAVIQHDLRELVAIERLELDESGTMLTFEFSKVHEGVNESVSYQLLHPPARHLDPGSAPDGTSTHEEDRPGVNDPSEEHLADRRAIADAVKAAKNTAVLRTFLGREERLFEETILDFKVHPFRHADEPGNLPIELKDPVEWPLLDYFQIRMTFVPGKDEFEQRGFPRTLSFVVYPRLLASRRKAVYGRFRLGEDIVGQRRLEEMVEQP